MIGQPIGSSTQFEEVNIDFRLSGLPHSVVKQAENSRVRELVKKIENHPHRQDLQGDLQQNNAYNPHSERSKKMIEDIDNVELFELCETFPKVQCKERLLHWIQGIVYCTWSQPEASFNGHWIFSQFKFMSFRMSDLMAIDLGRLENNENIYCP